MLKVLIPTCALLTDGICRFVINFTPFILSTLQKFSALCFGRAQLVGLLVLCDITLRQIKIFSLTKVRQIS